MSARACGFDPHSSEGVHSVNGSAQQIVDLLVWVRVPVNTYASLAQLEEFLPSKQNVVGSNPTWRSSVPTIEVALKSGNPP